VELRQLEMRNYRDQANSALLQDMIIAYTHTLA
jgi:hypothetical protein